MCHHRALEGRKWVRISRNNLEQPRLKPATVKLILQHHGQEGAPAPKSTPSSSAGIHSCPNGWAKKTKTELFGHKDKRHVWGRDGENTAPSMVVVASGSGTVLLLHRFQLLWNTLKLKPGCFVSTLSVWCIFHKVCSSFVPLFTHFATFCVCWVIFAHFGVICDML